MAEYKLGLMIGDLKDNAPLAASVGGREFAVVKIEGRIHVIDGRCSHKGGLLGKGHVDGVRIVCPLHEGAFNVETGQADENTPWVTDINAYRARVDNSTGEIYVEF